jgi:hypothetical protein
VSLELLLDGRVLGVLLANIFRPDLAQAGLGSLRHAFVFTPDATMDPSTTARLQVRRAGDRAMIPNALLAGACAP